MEGSRRSRIDSTSTEDLFWLGRRHLFFYGWRDRRGIALALLRFASARGHEESTWLVGQLEKPTELMFSGDSPRELAYRSHHNFWGHRIRDDSRQDAYHLFARRAADAGHPLAQAVFAIVAVERGSEQWHCLLEASSKGGEPLAHIELSEVNHVENLFSAAQDEHARQAALRFECSAWSIILQETNCKDRKEVAFWRLRTFLVTYDPRICVQEDNVTRLRELCKSRRPVVMYALGKELDGYNELYGTIPEINKCPECTAMVTCYRTVLHACRSAVLCVVHLFRHLVGRDVAKMIAVRVFATRTDVHAWIERNKKLKRWISS